MGRTFLNASAQSTVSGAITNSQTTLVLVSSANFGAPTTILPLSITILDTGNPAFSASNPLATPFERQLITNNNTGTNTLTINGGVRGSYAGTTPQSFFAGATVAVTLLAEDLNLLPQRFATQTPSSGSSFTQTIPGIFRHIEIDFSVAISTTNITLAMQLNGDTGAHYYWASGGDGSDTTRAGNGGAAVTSALVGFIGTSTAQSYSGRIRLNDIQQATRIIGWNFEGAYGNIGAPNLVALKGGGWWVPSSLAAVTSVTLLLSSGTFTSSNFDFEGKP